MVETGLPLILWIGALVERLGGNGRWRFSSVYSTFGVYAVICNASRQFEWPVVVKSRL